MLSAVAALAAALAGCAPGFLGSAIDRPPPLPAVRAGGPAGVLVQGAVPPYVPGPAVDAAVGDRLQPWLTPIERRSLAEASQRAAAAVTGTPVAWQALDGKGTATATGLVVPTRDIYRSQHGRLCRDVRQSIVKGEAPHRQQVTLCREDQGADLYVWVVDRAE